MMTMSKLQAWCRTVYCVWLDGGAAQPVETCTDGHVRAQRMLTECLIQLCRAEVRSHGSHVEVENLKKTLWTCVGILIHPVLCIQS
jgi:hypothetical protein